jgi:hypothetical protein
LDDDAGHPVTGGAVIRGVVARIVWARFPAAVIEGYTVTRSRAGAWSLTAATIVSANAYNLRQTPLTLVAPTEHGEWRWPIRTPIVSDRPPFHIAADLGPLEEIRHEPVRPTR